MAGPKRGRNLQAGKIGLLMRIALHIALACTSLVAPLILRAAQNLPSDTFQTSAGVIRITPVMHASVLIQAGGKNIYIDPAQGSFEGLPPADLVLITDIHGDHMSQPMIDKVKQAGTVVWGPKAVSEKIHVDTIIGNGDYKEVAGLDD